VVNSNLYFSFGLANLKHALAARAPSWKPDKISLSFPGYVQISPIANIPFLFVFGQCKNFIFFFSAKNTYFIYDFEFNQDISYEREIRSPGWLRLQKKLNEKK